MGPSDRSAGPRPDRRGPTRGRSACLIPRPPCPSKFPRTPAPAYRSGQTHRAGKPAAPAPADARAGSSVPANNRGSLSGFGVQSNSPLDIGHWSFVIRWPQMTNDELSIAVLSTDTGKESTLLIGQGLQPFALDFFKEFVHAQFVCLALLCLALYFAGGATLQPALPDARLASP